MNEKTLKMAKELVSVMESELKYLNSDEKKKRDKNSQIIDKAIDKCVLNGVIPAYILMTKEFYHGTIQHIDMTPIECNGKYFSILPKYNGLYIFEAKIINPIQVVGYQKRINREN